MTEQYGQTVSWLSEARKHIGKKEIPGAKSNPWITALWATAKWLGVDDSKVPWCGAFVAHCIKSAGLPLPKHWYRAKDWLNWGVPLTKPTEGCIVVFERQGGGHVGFVVGVDKAGNLMVLGGNQRDAVNILPFGLDRNPQYRWPALTPLPKTKLPLLASNGAVSTNEA
jgi:uncharacterized protein (TIGR02594 family)